MFNEQQSKYFISLSRTLSISRTAEEFQVSRQAVSKCIALMEEQFGSQLFERDKQNASLTEAGRLVLEYFIDSHERFDILKKRLSSIYDSTMKSLNIGFQDYLTIDIGFPSVFKSEGTKPFKASIDVCNHSPLVLLNYLMNKQLDVVIICKYLVSKLDLFEFRELKETPLYLLVSMRNSKVVPGASAADFIHEPLIVSRLKGENKPEFDERVRKYIALCKLEPSKIIVQPNLDSAYMAVKMGMGILICPSFSRFIGTHGVQAYDSGTEDALLCLWRKNDHNPIVNEFAEYLSERYHSDGRIAT